MPVGTQGAVKGAGPDELREVGAQIILGNTYHLFIRPGLEVIRHFGGLHEFCRWKGPILTDSGGFQVFSLAKIREIKEEGVHFRSHLDGAPLFIGPETSMEIQAALGADIAMAFDECPPYPCEHDYAATSLARTLRWAERCRAWAKSHAPTGQLHFGIVQGATFRRSARGIRARARGDGLGRLRGGRRERGRAGGGDDARDGRERAVSAGEPAALLHGPGHAAANRGAGGARHRHVRLRAADAARAARRGLHRQRHDQRAQQGLRI